MDFLQEIHARRSRVRGGVLRRVVLRADPRVGAGVRRRRVSLPGRDATNGYRTSQGYFARQKRPRVFFDRVRVDDQDPLRGADGARDTV